MCLPEPIEFIGENVRKIVPNPRRKILRFGRGLVTSGNAEVFGVTAVSNVEPLQALSALMVESVELAQP